MCISEAESWISGELARLSVLIYSQQIFHLLEETTSLEQRYYCGRTQRTPNTDQDIGLLGEHPNYLCKTSPSGSNSYWITVPDNQDQDNA